MIEGLKQDLELDLKPNTWTVLDLADRVYVVRPVHSGNMLRIICDCGNPAEHRAEHAQLIAAAPDMLAMLVSQRDALREKPVELMQHMDFKKFAELEELNALITKAGGSYKI